MPRPPHRGSPHLHPNHEIMVSDERDLSLNEIGDLLENIGKILKERGALTLKARGEKIEVKPPDPCPWMLRYERLPRGELKLKIELEWDERQGTISTPDVPVEFE